MSKEWKIALISILPVLLFDALMLFIGWVGAHPSTIKSSDIGFDCCIEYRPRTAIQTIFQYIEGLLGTLIMIVSSAIASVFICISKKTFKYKKVVIAFFITVVLSVFLLRIVSMWWFPPVF